MVVKPRVEGRVEPKIAEYLAKLSPEARAETFRRWMQEGYDRDPDNATARVVALHAEADSHEAEARKLREEAEAISSTVGQIRLQRSRLRENARVAVIAALPNIDRAHWNEFCNTPFGKDIMLRFGVDRAFIQSVIEEEAP